MQASTAAWCHVGGLGNCVTMDLHKHKLHWLPGRTLFANSSNSPSNIPSLSSMNPSGLSASSRAGPSVAVVLLEPSIYSSSENSWRSCVAEAVDPALFSGKSNCFNRPLATRLIICAKQRVQFACPGNSVTCFASSSTILSLHEALSQVTLRICDSKLSLNLKDLC